MATLHLTQRRIDTLKPKKVIQDVRDTELKGFGIRIMPSGTRRYFIHSQHEGRRIWKTFDDADTVTVVQARQRARVMLAAYRNGESTEPGDREGHTLRDCRIGSLCPLRTTLEARHAQGQPDLFSSADPALLRGPHDQRHHPAGCRSLVPISPCNTRGGKPIRTGPFCHHAEG